jgi:hypothetical protein
MFLAYSGPLVTVRRSSDNATQDIGFAQGGGLDTAAFSAFIGGGSGYVTKWWDQTGNGRHVIQVTNSKQPQLVLNALSGRPALLFSTASATELTCSGAGLPANSPHTMMALAALTVTSGAYGGICSYGGPANNTSALGTTSGGVWWCGGRFNTLQTGQANDTDPHVFIKTVTGSVGGTSHLYIDGADNINGASATYTCTVGDFTVGAAASGNSPFTGYVSEVMWIPSVLSTADRRLLESTANAWANLYDPLLYPTSFVSNYHVFLIAGQSNALGLGDGIDYSIEVADPMILQWTCGGPYFHTPMIARDPLHAPDLTNQNIRATKVPGVGFGPAFARAYRTGQSLDSNTGVILVNTAYGGSGMSNAKWRVGDPYYLNAIAQLNDCMANGPGITRTLKGILWHQGEVDVTANYLAATYRTDLLSTFDGLRTALTGGGSTLPIVVGQMVPEWIVSQLNGPAIDAIHQGIPTDRTYTGYWYGATGSANTVAVAGGNIHYNAAGQRTNGSAVYAAYLAALANH